MLPGSAARRASTGQGWKCWKGVNQVVVAPTVDVKAGVAGGAELLQVVLPLLLMVDAVSLHYVPDLVANAHIFTLNPLERGLFWVPAFAGTTGRGRE